MIKTKELESHTEKAIFFNLGDLCANSENSSQNGYPRKINFNI